MRTVPALVDDATLKRQLRRLDRMYPEAECALHHANPWQLLVATVLSAQCTDKAVNNVTPALFLRFPDPAAMASAELEEIEGYIRSIGLFRGKARNLQATARLMLERHGGQVPADMTELLQLPGVARKTANVVLGECFAIADGIVVDTHVARLSQRLGFVRDEVPGKIEKTLMQRIPRKRWILLSHQLISHGREVCQARRPRCESCKLAADCPSAEVP